MKVKNVAMMIAAGCALGMLTGCGVPQEEHDAKVAAMTAERVDLEDKLNGKVADLESVVKSEKAKVRTSRIELDDATERITGLQQKSAKSIKALASVKTEVAQLKTELATAKSAMLAAQDKATTIEEKFNALDVEYQGLKRRFEMFQSNMGSINSSSTPAASSALDVMDAEESKSDSDTAKSLMDQMLTM